MSSSALRSVCKYIAKRCAMAARQTTTSIEAPISVAARVLHSVDGRNFQAFGR